MAKLTPRTVGKKCGRGWIPAKSKCKKKKSRYAMNNLTKGILGVGGGLALGYGTAQILKGITRSKRAGTFLAKPVPPPDPIPGAIDVPYKVITDSTTYVHNC